MKKQQPTDGQSDAGVCSPSSYVPYGLEWESEVMKNRKGDIIELFRRSCKERDEARHELLALFAREHLTCGWCGEMMQAPPNFSLPMTTEKLKTTVRLHLTDCPKHPMRELLEAGREIIEAARRSLPRAHPTIERNAKLFISENAQSVPPERSVPDA